jgi:hypothetical protein
MKNLNAKVFIWVLVVVSVLVWIGVLRINGTELKVTWKAMRQLPAVVSIDVMLWLLFVKWGWKYRIFQKWLVPFPNLEGTWEGTLQTIWSDPETGNISGTIPVILVIKQSFISISCVMYSQEMTSRSHAAEFLIDSEANLKKLTYTYTSIPRVTVRDRSVVHNGTVLLNIITSPDLALYGEYWTNRKSAGEITLKFRSKELLQDFPNDLITKKGV